jgi:alpha-galactosidase
MQWACSHVFPAAAMAAHVTRWGERPMEFACAVALSGRFGFDLDLESLDERDRAICRRAVAWARRTQDLVQQGELVRMVSPVEGPDTSRAALAHLSADRRRGVVFAYQLEEPTEPPPRIRLRGLDPAAEYRIRSTDLGADEPEDLATSSGAELASAGLEWPSSVPLTARTWELERVED